MALYKPRNKQDVRSVRVNYSITPDLNSALKERATKLEISVNELVNKYLARGIESDERQERRKQGKQETMTADASE